MKRIILLVGLFLLLCGCNKNNNVVNTFVKKLDKVDNYKLIGNMDIMSNEDTFSYKVEASKSKNGYYKVSLVNKNNNHEQIILKNKDGVYVVTPDLNKSFKFQSDWPNNGSQSYLLDMLLNDVKNDDNVHVETDKDIFIQCKVNYPNNNTLYSEKIYLDKDYNVKKVEVLDQDGNIKIKLNIKKIDYKKKFDNKYFDLNNYVKNDDNDNSDKEITEDENTGYILKDIIYPLYIPTNTKLSTEDTISTTDGNRAILTFKGDNPFVLVEEVSRRYDELEIIPVNGDPLIMSDSIGAISSNSLYWTSNGIDYYVSGNSLSSNELLTIAEGLTGTSIIVSSEK